MYRERIAQAYNQLSPSYRRIADFLLSNYREASFMTAAELGQAVGVDTTTVVRCAQRLGYNGYPELIHDVQMQVKGELQSAYAPLEGDTSLVATWQRSLLRDIENLQQVLALPAETLESLVRAVRSAQRVLVLSAGYANALGEVLASALRHLGKWVDHAPVEAMSQAFALSQVGHEDAVIGMAASSDGGEVAAALQVAKGRGAKTIGIFGSYASPIARVADLKIFAPNASSGPYASMTAMAAVLVAILQVLAQGDQEGFNALLSEFQRNYQSIISGRDREASESRFKLLPLAGSEADKIG